MALQESGTISLSDIQTEFGGSNPISISEYYSVDGLIPDSGVISISDFYGASSGFVEMSNFNITAFETNSFATASIQYNSEGSITTSPATSNNWFSKVEAGVGDDYEIFVSVIAGATPTGTINQWLSLSTLRYWSITDYNFGSSSVSTTLSVFIRDAATQTIQDSATHTLTANYWDL